MVPKDSRRVTQLVFTSFIYTTTTAVRSTAAVSLLHNGTDTRRTHIDILLPLRYVTLFFRYDEMIYSGIQTSICGCV